MTTTAATSRRTEPTPPRVRASRSAFLYIQYYRCGAFHAPSRRHDARTAVLAGFLVFIPSCATWCRQRARSLQRFTCAEWCFALSHMETQTGVPGRSSISSHNVPAQRLCALPFCSDMGFLMRRGPHLTAGQPKAKTLLITCVCWDGCFLFVLGCRCVRNTPISFVCGWLRSPSPPKFNVAAVLVLSAFGRCEKTPIYV